MKACGFQQARARAQLAVMLMNYEKNHRIDLRDKK
jgi:hypothetical protein